MKGHLKRTRPMKTNQMEFAVNQFLELSKKIVSFDFRTEYIGLEVSGFQLDCRCLYIYGNSSSMKKIHETVRSEKHVVDVAISIVDETNFNLAHIFLWKFVIPSIRNFIKKYFLSLR